MLRLACSRNLIASSFSLTSKKFEYPPWWVHEWEVNPKPIKPSYKKGRYTTQENEQVYTLFKKTLNPEKTQINDLADNLNRSPTSIKTKFKTIKDQYNYRKSKIEHPKFVKGSDNVGTHILLRKGKFSAEEKKMIDELYKRNKLPKRKDIQELADKMDRSFGNVYAQMRRKREDEAQRTLVRVRTRIQPEDWLTLDQFDKFINKKPEPDLNKDVLAQLENFEVPENTKETKPPQIENCEVPEKNKQTKR